VVVVVVVVVGTCTSFKERPQVARTPPEVHVIVTLSVPSEPYSSVVSAQAAPCQAVPVLSSSLKPLLHEAGSFAILLLPTTNILPFS
jgi:hypothetical protein